jgi:hypothetical protein
MTCDAARRALSARLDGELAAGEHAALDAHVATCAVCARFAASIAELRQGLRFEAVAPDSVPDVAPAVVAAVVAAPPRRSRAADRHVPALLKVAAALVAGAVAGATFVGVTHREPSDIAFAGVPAEVAAAQNTIDTLSAEVHVTEHGFHPDVPTRTFSGHLRYRAPESLALTLDDHTVYPSADWVRDDVRLVVDGDTWWTSGPRACPVQALPACTPDTPDVSVVRGREPFATDSPVPLDLVTPVASFGAGGDPAPLGERTIAGRDAVGVRTTAARIEPLLAGLAPAGNLRAIAPSDEADVWLDRTTLVPLAVTVRAAAGPDRAAWAAIRGYADAPGRLVLAVSLSSVAVNDRLPSGSFPAPPPDAALTRNGGFHSGGDAVAAVPPPTSLPAGFAAYRSGTVDADSGPAIGLRTWTDGRAWLEVRATTAWPGGRLFGDMGDVVRRVDLAAGRAGVGYVDGSGSRVAVHTPALDVVVAGTTGTTELLAVAASLGLVGTPVPPAWPESATATLADARAAAPDLLVPSGLPAFGPPAIRVDGDTVALAYTGGGDRSFLLTRTGAAALLPPVDPDARGVRVRGTDGRYLPSTGQLEWVEDGHAYRLESSTLSIGELLAVAARLRAGP